MLSKIVFFLIIVLQLSDAAFTQTSRPFRRSSSIKMTILTYGSKKKNFKAGSPLKNACANLGIKPKYSCKKGDCGSCTMTVGGSRVKVCVGKVPAEPTLKSLKEKGLAIR